MDLFDFDFSNSEDGQKPKMIFFDTETTGSKDDDQIIEIGAIIEDFDGAYEIYNELCATTGNKLIDIEAMAVHGIRNEEIEGKKPFEKSDFYAKVNELNNSSNYLIAHNLPFDLGKLEYYGFKAKCKLIDTLQCAKHLFEIGEKLGEYEYALPNYKLQTFRYALFSKADEAQMASKYGADIKAHNAIGDVIILKMFFNELLKRVEQEHSNFSLEESLEYLSELSKKPVLIKTFTFGKYKGKLIKDVAKKDIGYINWLYSDIKKRKNSGESIDENMYNTLKAILEQV